MKTAASSGLLGNLELDPGAALPSSGTGHLPSCLHVDVDPVYVGEIVRISPE